MSTRLHYRSQIHVRTPMSDPDNRQLSFATLIHRIYQYTKKRPGRWLPKNPKHWPCCPNTMGVSFRHFDHTWRHWFARRGRVVSHLCCCCCYCWKKRSKRLPLEWEPTALNVFVFVSVDDDSSWSFFMLYRNKNSSQVRQHQDECTNEWPIQ